MRRAARAGAAAARATAAASLFAACAVLAALAAGCGHRSDSGATRPESPPYVSFTTGFRFKAPPSWPPERFLVTEVTGDDASAREPGALSIAEVQFQPADLGHRPEPLLRITVFPDSTWNRIERTAGGSLGSIVARARDRTYLAITPQANPYPDGSADAAAFDAMHLALTDVKRWLSVADAAGDLASDFLPGGPTFGPAPVMYLATLAPSTPARRVRVIFRADSTALFSTEFAGNRVVNERGIWSLQGPYVRLQLLNDAGLLSGGAFIWAIRDSALAPITWDREKHDAMNVTLLLRPKKG